MSLAPMLNRQACHPTRRLVILGASGSVGTTAIAYLALRPDIVLEGVSVHKNTERLEEVLHAHRSVRLAGISDGDAFATASDGGIRERHPNVHFFAGESGLIALTHAAAEAGADTVLTAVVGACGIQATVAALGASMKVALANKETLITAGPAIEALMQAAASRGGSGPSILPVDSEHNALFQLLHGTPAAHVRRLVLTASGGPFRDTAAADISRVTKDEVLQHPTWNMGPKITVDSAGMINKGLEIIEAHYLFGMPYEKLSACIHRKSVVHGMLETTDGGFLLAASAPDMVFPIAHALCYPDAVPEVHKSALLPREWPELVFEPVDEARYPGFRLCLAAGASGGTAPAVFNAANEVAVGLFLEDRLHFSEIAHFISTVMDLVPIQHGRELELFLDADHHSRRVAYEVSARTGVAQA